MEPSDPGSQWESVFWGGERVELMINTGTITAINKVRPGIPMGLCMGEIRELMFSKMHNHRMYENDLVLMVF